VSLKKLYKNSLFVTVFIFLTAVIIVSPWGDHSVNDDWDFYTSTRFFGNGDVTLGPQTDTAFILQGLIGSVWASVFGFNYSSLRVLTLIFSIISLCGVYVLLKSFSVNRSVILLTLLTIAFNPLFFTSSLSYMTEIYFFALVIWSIAFFIKALSKSKLVDSWELIIAATLAGFSLLVRQYGVVLFVSYFISILFSYWKSKQVSWIKLLYLGTPLVLSFCILSGWPKITDPASKSLFSVDPVAITHMFKLAPYLLIYIGFFTAPLVLLYVSLLEKRTLTFALVGSFLLAPFLYAKDIFPIGNVFYLEGLYGKSNFVHNLSLFDNIPFKIFIALEISFVLLISIFLILKLFAAFRREIDTRKLLLALTALGMYAVVFAGVFAAGDFYDRYFINGYLLTIILLGIFSTFIKRIPYKSSIFALVLLSFITVFLSWDFYSSEEIRWNVGRRLQEEKGLYNSVFVNGTFTKFMHYNVFNSPKDVYAPVSSGLTYECFVHFYTRLNKNNLLYSFLHRFENSRTLNKYITNPPIYNSKLSAGVEPLGWHWNDIEYEITYFSPIYSLLGIEPVVASYCRE